MKLRMLHFKRICMIFIVFFCLFLVDGVARAYTPPIGIPDPGMWGTTHPIDTPAPSIASKCPGWPNTTSVNCYYIDNTNINATDTDNTNGSPAKPRLTAASGSYEPGSYIEIHGGPYTAAITATMNGTPADPIWLRGSSPTTMPDFRAKISIPDAKYTIIENINFNNFTGVAISITGLSANNICIRNSTFQKMIYPGNSSAVIASTPTQGGNIHDLVFYNNLFQDIGDWQATDDQDYHAINPTLWGRTPPTTQYNVWSLNNTAVRIAGSLNQFNGDQRDATKAVSEGRTVTNLQNFHHMYSGKNLMHQSRQAIGAPKFTTDAIYSQNVAYDLYSTASSAGSGQVYQEGSRYVWLLFNKYSNLTYGIRSSNTNFPGVETADLRAYMIGNVIYNINNDHQRAYNVRDTYKPAQAIGFEKGYYKRYIIDNTFYNIGGGLNVGGQVAGDHTEISGNVIAGVYGIDDNGAPDYHLTFKFAEGTYAVDRNFFQPRADNGLISVKWAGAQPAADMFSLEVIQSSTGQCSNCQAGDPMFTDPSQNDLHPTAGSPLIDKGSRHPVYDEFKARYGIDISYDFDGNPRPSGTQPWTIGAYEYNTSPAGSAGSSPPGSESIFPVINNIIQK